MSSPSGDDWSSLDSGETTPEPTSRRKFMVRIVIAVIAIFASCVVTGFLVMTIGIGAIDEELKVLLEGNEVIQTHIGEIQELEIDWGRTFEADGENASVYDVKGTVGSGTMLLDLGRDESGEQFIVSGALTLESGAEFNLLP